MFHKCFALARIQIFIDETTFYLYYRKYILPEPVKNLKYSNNSHVPIKFQKRSDVYFELSNLCMSPITVDLVTYNSVEIYFQSKKCQLIQQKFKIQENRQSIKKYLKDVENESDENIEKILYNVNYLIMRSYGPETKKYAEHLNAAAEYCGWHENGYKDKVMLDGLMLKFGQHPNLCLILLNYSSNFFIFTADDDNMYWGRGLNGEGLNVLGKMLTYIRILEKMKEYSIEHDPYICFMCRTRNCRIYAKDMTLVIENNICYNCKQYRRFNNKVDFCSQWCDNESKNILNVEKNGYIRYWYIRDHPIYRHCLNCLNQPSVAESDYCSYCKDTINYNNIICLYS